MTAAGPKSSGRSACLAPRPVHLCPRGGYCSSRRSACGSSLACDRAETDACTRTWDETNLLCSAARSTSMMEDFAASMFSSEVAICWRSEEHTSELQSLMRSSYAVFCLKTKQNKQQ